MVVGLEQHEYESDISPQQLLGDSDPGESDTHLHPHQGNGDDLFPHPPDIVEPEEDSAGGLVRLTVDRTSACRYQVRASAIEDDRLLVHDTVDLSRSGSREKVINSIVQQLHLAKEDAANLAKAIDEALIQKIHRKAVRNESSVTKAQRYFADEDNADVTKQGLYAETPNGPIQLTNFVVKITEDRIFTDTDAEGSSRIYRGTIRCLGQVNPFEVTTEKYVDQLETVIHNSAGPRVQFLAKPAVIRNAISSTISPTVRRVTTSTGWTVDCAMFLVPGGWVDSDGYHLNADGHKGPEVDLEREEHAQWLGFTALTGKQLESVKRHLASDFLKLHHSNLMLTMLGAVALAPMLRFVGVSSRPALWLQGLTGNGKSFIARLAMSFFGDFDTPGGERYICWKATGNYLQKAGFFFRDMLYLIDDYKRDDCRHSDVVRILQCYSDGSARSRLRADTSMNRTQPIRGLLLATGEDFPEANASGMARSVVMRVPSHPKDFSLTARCQQMRGLYRGFTAAFIADVIRHQRWVEFTARVEHWRSHYHSRVAGRANDVRIAGNFACLAAAVELVCEYLRDIWSEATEVAQRYNEEYLMSLVHDSAGEVEGETAARIFLDSLDTLFDFGRARIEGLIVHQSSASKSYDNGKAVGRLSVPYPGAYARSQSRSLHPDEVIGLSTKLSLEVVQESLRAQGKQQLQVSERTLVDQLAAAGVLVDRHHRAITSESAGERTWKSRLDGDSRNIVGIRAGAFPSLVSAPGSEAPGFRQPMLTAGGQGEANGHQAIIELPPRAATR